MKVKVKKVPGQSSKKTMKVKVKSLPKAGGGLNVMGLPSDDDLEPIITEQSNNPASNNLGVSDLLDQDITNPYKFNPKLTNQLVNYYKGKGQNPEITLTPDEQSQYDDYLNDQKINNFSNVQPQSNLLGSMKQFFRNMASKKINRKVRNMENNIYAQNVFSRQTNPTPYEELGFGVEGRNPLTAADGMQIRQIGGMGEPNVEVEGREHIKLPNGFSQEIQGKSHAEGGIPLNLPQGTQIFSEKLKVQVKFLKELAELNPEYAFLAKIKLPDKGVISYADLAKKFETKKYVDLLNSKAADPIQKATAQMMMSQSLMALEKIFMLQEQNKLSGVHGPQVQQNAMEQMEESKAQEQQESQQEQSMEQEPMMKHGGYHLPKAQLGNMPVITSGGVGVKQYSPKTSSGRYTGETNFDITQEPSSWKGNLTEWDQAYSQQYGLPGFTIADLAQDPKIAKRYEALPGKDPLAGLYQEYMYDYHLDRLAYPKNFSPEEVEKSRQALRKMWQPTGSTRYGLSKGIQSKGIDFDKAGYEEYNKLRPSFIDAIGKYRYLKPNELPIETATPAAKTPEQKTTTEQPEEKAETSSDEPSLNYIKPLGATPIYASPIMTDEPMNYYSLIPEYVQAPIQQPYTYDIDRAMRAAITNATDLSGSGMGNRQAAFSTGIGEKSKRQDIATARNLENKFKADMFNAQNKYATNVENLKNWLNYLELPRRQRKGVQERQKMMNQKAFMENMALANQYGASKGLLDESLNPYKNMSAADLISSLIASNEAKSKEKSKTVQGKYGGKVKIKPKFRK